MMLTLNVFFQSFIVFSFKAAICTRKALNLNNFFCMGCTSCNSYFQQSQSIFVSHGKQNNGRSPTDTNIGQPGDHDVTPQPAFAVRHSNLVLFGIPEIGGVNENIVIRSLGEEATKKGILKYVIHRY